VPAPPRPARERLLDAADRLFYGHGIHAVGVDAVITEAGVTRATFYRHFPAKDELVRAYVQRRDAAVRDAAHAVLARRSPPGEALAAVVAGIDADVCRPGSRGCPFINAAVEYPDPAHPAAQAVQAHRAWFRELLVTLLTALGRPEPDADADVLVLLRDGAMVGGGLDGGDRASAALHRAVAGLLGPVGLGSREPSPAESGS
jgi:AcrR family transcriptional regulator